MWLATISPWFIEPSNILSPKTNVMLARPPYRIERQCAGGQSDVWPSLIWHYGSTVHYGTMAALQTLADYSTIRQHCRLGLLCSNCSMYRADFLHWRTKYQQAVCLQQDMSKVQHCCVCITLNAAADAQCALDRVRFCFWLGDNC